MEYNPWESLGACLRTGNTMNEMELQDIAACCLLGLDDLHRHGLTHGVENAGSE